ncbi:hypothetical protein [Streptomyces virginiae]|uniref:vWA-MoxR associated conflict system protein n=1 Tax=Streptomyces virginiae TaxID=1961 RepID=UPI00364D87DE
MQVKGAKATGVGGDMMFSAIDGSTVTYIGQQIVLQVQHGDISAMTAEVRRVLGWADVAGALGYREVMEAAAAWKPDMALPGKLSFADLSSWQQELANESCPDAASGRMACAVAGLMECTVTAAFLIDTFPNTLTSEHLSMASRRAGLPMDDESTDPLRDMLECAVFEAQRLADPPGAALARAVAALAYISGMDRPDAQLAQWAHARGLVVRVSDVLKEFTRPAPPLRLVISLADVRQGSPGQAEYWLTRGGEPTTGAPRPVTHDLNSIMTVIKDALTWAWEKELREDETLDHLDVVAPVSLLTDLMSKPWALEDRPLSTFDLGARHSLLMRWSGRLSPDPAVPYADNIAEINDAARKALQDMSGCHDPVTWLEPSHFLPESEEDLRRKLSAGHLGAAIGFSPSITLERALPALLPYVPIIVWPRPGTPTLDESLRERVRANWHRQPHDFADAYRRHATDHPANQCLCDLHAVTHDEAWLNFCRLITARTVTAPKETP